MKTLLLLGGMLSAAQAEGLRRITLEEAQALAGGAHRDAEARRLSEQGWRLDRSDHRLRLLPQLNLRLTAPSINDSEQEVIDTKGTVSNVRVQSERRFGGIDLSSELPSGTSLVAGLSLSRLRSDTDSYQYPYDTNYSFSLQQQVFGRSWLFEELARDRRRLEQQRRQVSEEGAVFRHRVKREYYTLLQAQMAHELDFTGLQESDSSLSLSRRKFEAGIIAESDFLKLELENLERHSRFTSDSLALRLSEESFRRLLRLPSGELFELDRSVPIPAVDTELAPHLERAREANLDVLADRLSLYEAQLGRREAWRDLLPTVNLSMSWDQAIEDSTLNTNFDDGRLNRSLSLRLNWPLFTWGERRRAWQRSRISVRRAELAREAGLESLELQLRGRLNRICELQALIPLRARQLELAERDYEITQERFRSGQITSQELIDAERTLSSVRLQELGARINLVLAVAELDRLTGADREEVLR